MTIREELEARERQTLSSYARCAADTLGRERPMEPCPLRTAFQRDRDRIIHSKSFRRLKFKTQVFLAPEGDHYRTRLTHTLEVAQVARTLARSMRLNEDLAEAIALGHDLGHTPFGHTGERALDALSPAGFHHNEQSVRVVEVLENAGAGLNLTREVRDGILTHTGDQLPMTLEGECVRRADRIAYINHDIDDALRAGVLKAFELPAECIRLLGDTQGKRINTMIMDIMEHSEPGEIRMGDTVQAATDELRAFLFRRVYQDGWRIEEEERCTMVMRALYKYYINHPTEMSDEYILIGYKDGSDQAVCDYLACMTDRYAMRLYQRLFLPSAYPIM